MIHAAVSHISGQPNQFLKRSFDPDEDVVVMFNPVEQDGNLAQNKGYQAVVV